MSIASRPDHVEEFERAFEKVHETSQRVKFDIKCTEAQHNRRFLLQRRTEEQRKGNGHQLLSGGMAHFCT
jgi:hypothetical protein